MAARAFRFLHPKKGTEFVAVEGTELYRRVSKSHRGDYRLLGEADPKTGELLSSKKGKAAKAAPETPAEGAE